MNTNIKKMLTKDEWELLFKEYAEKYTEDSKAFLKETRGLLEHDFLEELSTIKMEYLDYGEVQGKDKFFRSKTIWLMKYAESNRVFTEEFVEGFRKSVFWTLIDTKSMLTAWRKAVHGANIF